MAKAVHVSKLTNEQWAEIKRIGRKLHDEGIYDRDNFKIAVTAFIRWVREQDMEIYLDRAEELYPMMFQ